MRLIGFALLLILALPSSAWAYIDPGAGSYLFQLLIAGGVAGLYTLRRYWHAVVGQMQTLVRRFSSRGPGPGADGVE